MMHLQNYDDVLEIQPLTVSDYQILIEAECLDDYRVELLNGFFAKMNFQSAERIAAAFYLFSTFFKALKNCAVICDSKPIPLMKLNLEPDLDILVSSRVVDVYNTSIPSPSDVLLVTEVSNSTIKRHRTIKLED